MTLGVSLLAMYVAAAVLHLSREAWGVYTACCLALYFAGYATNALLGRIKIEDVETEVLS